MGVESIIEGVRFGFIWMLASVSVLLVFKLFIKNYQIIPPVMHKMSPCVAFIFPLTGAVIGVALNINLNSDDMNPYYAFIYCMGFLLVGAVTGLWFSGYRLMKRKENQYEKIRNLENPFAHGDPEIAAKAIARSLKEW